MALPRDAAQVCADDYAWLHALTSPTQRQGTLRPLHRLGFAPDRAEAAVGLIERMLSEEGPLKRAVIAERLAARGVRAEGLALVQLLFLASLQGITIRGPLCGAEQAFVLARDWLGDGWRLRHAADQRGRALAELARRYLAGHGPATPADLALWAGLPIRDARGGFEAIAGELRQPGGELVELRTRRRSTPELQPRLLPVFDPFLLGWKDRAFSVPEERLRQVRNGGFIRPVALVDGVAAATWTSRRSGARVTVDIDHWEGVHAGAWVAPRRGPGPLSLRTDTRSSPRRRSCRTARIAADPRRRRAAARRRARGRCGGGPGSRR